jgi:type 1 glutamine amidotransferase
MKFFKVGRIFYTAVGHFDEAYADALFLKHLEKGVEWADGEEVENGVVQLIIPLH